MDETSDADQAPDDQKPSLAWKVLSGLVIATLFFLTTAWLVLVARSILGLMDWLFG